MHHARYVVVILVLLLVATFFLFRNKPTGFLPTEDEGRVFITFELPEASSTIRSVEVLQKMMGILERDGRCGALCSHCGTECSIFFKQIEQRYNFLPV